MSKNTPLMHRHCVLDLCSGSRCSLERFQYTCCCAVHEYVTASARTVAAAKDPLSNVRMRSLLPVFSLQEIRLCICPLHTCQHLRLMHMEYTAPTNQPV